MPGTPGPTTTAGQQVTSDRQAIQDAANSAGIPFAVLWGVYGAESSFGKAYAPGGSAAGQPTYGYFGLTSPGLWHPGMTFQQDANTAANLLSKLYKAHGNNWDAALQAYSGGGYGLAHVQQLAGSQTGSNQIANIPGAVGSAVGAVGSAVSSVGDVAGTIGNIASWLTTPSSWLTILKYVAGAVLIFVGLTELAGVDKNVANIVEKAGPAMAAA